MKKLTIAAAVLSAFALLGGCGASDENTQGTSGSAPASEQAEANQADITFAQSMIPHHEQAIDMAELAADRAASKQVIDLAKQIEQAQNPEVETMRRWLDQWGAAEQMPHGDGGHSEMSGMMSDQHMAELERAAGAEFDRMWLRMMIEHHEGAIEMARAELKDGSYPAAQQLARAIIDAQQSEIDVMSKLLKQS
ncbi:MAG: DUF305 domain-containing protein [Actinophytocola sp.]|nr:DUF305 domain-containing protein [Actinophytocola sp.]